MTGPFGDPSKLLGQLTSKLSQIKDEAGRVEAEGQAGGGMVKVRANGRMEIVGVAIEPGMLESSDREMIEDLIRAATNQALRNAQAEMAEKFKALTGGIPPIPAALNALLGSTGDSGPTPRSGYVTDLSQSWIQTYPDISSPEDWYTEVGATEIPAAAELCQGAQLAALDQPFHTYFNRSVPVELSRIPAMEQPMYNTSAIPILIQQGSADTSVVPQVSRAMAVQGCALGNLVDYQEFPNDVHRSVQYTSRTQYLEWLAARFTGQPVDDSCRGW